VRLSERLHHLGSLPDTSKRPPAVRRAALRDKKTVRDETPVKPRCRDPKQGRLRVGFKFKRSAAKSLRVCSGSPRCLWFFTLTQCFERPGLSSLGQDYSVFPAISPTRKGYANPRPGEWGVPYVESRRRVRYHGRRACCLCSLLRCGLAMVGVNALDFQTATLCGHKERTPSRRDMSSPSWPDAPGLIIGSFQSKL
jgi:hypothetical protein